MSEEDLSAESYTVAFPDGIEVTDYVNKAVYTTGLGAAGDLAAIDKFLDLHSEDNPDQDSQFGPLSILVSLNVFALVMAAFWYRVKRKSKVLSLSLAVSLGSSSIAAAQEAVLPTGQRLKVRQCGHLTTMFALRYFSRGNKKGTQLNSQH